MKRFFSILVLTYVIIGIFSMQAEEFDYDQEYRAQYHYSPMRNWMNDPNGLVYNEATKEYHMFYQYCQTLEEDQNAKYWGHAVSKDLVHWQELQAAISPDDIGSIWSGSCVIDKYNTSGFFDDSTPAGARMVALFTYAGGDTTQGFEKQGIAYSKDNGLTWTKYEGNPVLGSVRDGNTIYDGGFRDPKVIWYEDDSYQNGGIWLMVVAGGKARIFTSPDLKNWTYNSTMTYMDGTTPIESECPDFYPLSVQGDESDADKWIYSAAGRSYVVGELIKDSESKFTFKAETNMLTLMNLPTDMYAAQTFFNDPKGRRIAVYWMIDLSSKEENNLGEKAWDGVQSLPMEMKLLKDADGEYQLRAYPVEELNALKGDTALLEVSNETFSGTYEKVSAVTGELLYIDIVFDPGTASRIVFDLRAGGDEKTTVSYNAKSGMMTLVRSESGAFIKENTSTIVPLSENGTVHMQIYVDRSVVDIFTDTGANSLHGLIYPAKSSVGLRLRSSGGEATIKSLNIYEMKSAWNKDYTVNYTPYPSEPFTTDASSRGDSNTAELILIIAAAVLGTALIGLCGAGLLIKKKNKPEGDSE